MGCWWPCRIQPYLTAAAAAASPTAVSLPHFRVPPLPLWFIMSDDVIRRGELTRGRRAKSFYILLILKDGRRSFPFYVVYWPKFCTFPFASLRLECNRERAKVGNAGAWFGNAAIRVANLLSAATWSAHNLLSGPRVCLAAFWKGPGFGAFRQTGLWIFSPSGSDPENLRYRSDRNWLADSVVFLPLLSPFSTLTEVTPPAATYLLSSDLSLIGRCRPMIDSVQRRIQHQMCLIDN